MLLTGRGGSNPLSRTRGCPGWVRTCVRMTHPVGTISRSLQLAAEGRSATEVARMVGVPRGTVRDWMYGRVPRRSRHGVCDGCDRCGRVHDFGSLPPVYAYLLGMYLGDGCLSAHRRDVFKLRISLDARYPEIVEECRHAIQTVMPQSRVNLVDMETWFELYSYSKSWPCLFPQHGPGKKHKRPIVLSPWQEALVSRRPDRLLRGLLHSDGCRSRTRGVADGRIRGTPSPTHRRTSTRSTARPATSSACVGRRRARGRPTCRERTMSRFSTCSWARSAD